MLQKRIEFWGEGIVMYDMKRLNANDDPADDITVTREFYPYTTSSVLDGEPAKTYTRGETQNNPIIAIQNNPDPSGLIEPWKG